ncbi:MAG: virulence RhuM family protein [Prevotellaceae bacterium]|nr:virulence RhuM family protein [Prevotellaceae bacterium]
MADINNKDFVIYKTRDSEVSINVLVENESVWLTQSQMGMLFGKGRNTINEHIKNVFAEGELDEKVSCRKFRHDTPHGAMSGKTKTSYTNLYNLDVIISVGYRVKSQQGTQFRIWANSVLKEYILKGYAIHQRFEQIDNKLSQHEQKLLEHQKQIDFIVRTEILLKEGVFYNGQIFDAYKFVSDLIETAKKEIVVIDNYADASVLTLLSKRKNGVKATLFTRKISETLQLDLQRHNAQYPEIFIAEKTNIHDRFLLIDNDLYHIGASLKDLGKKLFAFNKMEMTASELLINIEK